MDNISLSTVLWQCRRGMLELDILLHRYAENCFESLSSEDKALFTRLLACSDQELYQWLLGTAKPELEYNALIDQIKQYSCKA